MGKRAPSQPAPINTSRFSIWSLSLPLPVAALQATSSTVPPLGLARSSCSAELFQLEDKEQIVLTTAAACQRGLLFQDGEGSHTLNETEWNVCSQAHCLSRASEVSTKRVFSVYDRLNQILRVTWWTNCKKCSLFSYLLGGGF